VKRTQIAVAVVALSFGGLFLWRSRSLASQRVVTSEPGQTPPLPVTQGGTETPNVQPEQPTTQAPPPKVDIVFAVDTTGSMSGLIAGAKAKIWEIARKAQQGQPSPQLRVGLVAYRDVGDAYVTKVLDLTRDMDKVYSTLSDFRADGGGDTPEHVLKGLHDAIDVEHWSDDPQAVKLVYLVGDAPPHLDYHDGLTLNGVLGDARQKGIRISAIRCGTDSQTLAAWTNIAQKTDGEVASIEQSGGVAMVSTPYDAELARLNGELSKTEVHWGSAAERRAAADDVTKSLGAPAAAQAERASFYGIAAAASAAPMKRDLAASPSAAPMATMPPADLPDEMQAMSAEERTRFLEQKRAERAAILAQVQATSAKREEYLKTKAPPPAPSSFDGKVYDSLKKAGAKKGIAF
jgi:Mg-chelatase subunit ChlD